MFTHELPNELSTHRPQGTALMTPGQGNRTSEHSGSAQRRAWEDAVASIVDSADEAAFSSLFAHFAPRIKAFLMRQGETMEAAEELAQESMLTLWNRAQQFDRTKATVSTWLFTIARNKRIDRMRKRRRLEPDPSDPAYITEDKDHPDSIVGNNQEARQIRMDLNDLPDGMRDVLKLSFFGDLTHVMIAEQLDLPLGTVKSRIRRGLALLRDKQAEIEP